MARVSLYATDRCFLLHGDWKLLSDLSRIWDQPVSPLQLVCCSLAPKHPICEGGQWATV